MHLFSSDASCCVRTVCRAEGSQSELIPVPNEESTVKRKPHDPLDPISPSNPCPKFLLPVHLLSALSPLPTPPSALSCLHSLPITSWNPLVPRSLCRELSSHFSVLPALISPLRAFPRVTTSSFPLSAPGFLFSVSCQFSHILSDLNVGFS